MSTLPRFCMDDEPMETPTGSPLNRPSSADSDFQTAMAVAIDELDSPGSVHSLEASNQGADDDQTYRVDSPALAPSAENPQHGPATLQSFLERLGRCHEAAQYALEKRIELPLLNFVDADTLVFIDPPPVTRKGGCECKQAPPDQAPHRMHSRLLEETGSAYFIDALGPKRQYRTVRRRRLTNLPPGIKYVIDLTPPEEGDTAVELTTELSCSKGILQWFYVEERWEILPGLIDGHDDFQEKEVIENARCPRPPPQAGGGVVAGQKRNKTLIPMDYTPVRHRSAIERVLNIIEGLPPRIDSAPKMWSVFCVAKFLDCTSVVKDPLLSWIYAERNERFIEVLPEVSLRIADGLQNQMLCRDAFCVLVGEEALASVGKEISGSSWSSRARRWREGLDLDSFVTRVEYASKAFAERVNKTFTDLMDGDWITEVREYRKISAFPNIPLNGYSDAIEALSIRLRSFVQTRIYSTLSELFQVSGYFPSGLTNSYIGQNLFSCKSHSSVYGSIQHKEALLIRDYWASLMGPDLLAQYPPLQRPGAYVRVSGIEYKIDKTTWPELLKETKRFNCLVAEMTTRHRSSPIFTRTLGTSEGTLDPKLTDMGSSIKPEIYSTNRLPLRPKSGHNPPTTGAPDTSGTKDLPIRSKPWIKPLTPSAVLRRRLSSCITARRETDGQRPSSSGDLGSTIDPRDIAVIQQERDSDEVLGAREILVPDSRAWAASVPDGASTTRSSLGGAIVGAGYPAQGATQEVNYSNYNSFYPFNLDTFLGECQDYIRAVVMNMTKPGTSFDPAVTDTLLSLDENEFKYLPLYAGGNDDGSGGVFEEIIPNAVTGPIGPGPKYHIGMGSAASSEFEIVDAESSSFDTSMGVEDGYSDHLDRRKVYSGDAMLGFAEIDDDYDDMSEDKTVVAHNSDGEADEEFYDAEDDLMLFT